MKSIIDHIEPIAHKLVDHCQQKMGLSERPGLFFIEDDDNARKTFGKTAYYDPSSKDVVVFVTGRHSKDILRSIAHELVHHMQNLRGDFDDSMDTSPGYAQKDPKLRKMEAEAYLMGNMLFRDWEDGIKSRNLQESKEKSKMNIDTIKKLVRNKIIDILKEGQDDDDFMYGRFKDVPGYEKESDPKNYKKVQEEVEEVEEGMCGKRDEAELEEQSKTDLPDRGAQRAQGGRRLDELEDETQEPLSDFYEEPDEDQYGRRRSDLEDNDPDLRDRLRSLRKEQKPDFPDVDGDGDTTEPISKASKEKKDKEGDKSDKKEDDKESGDSDKDLSKVPPQLRKHVAGKMDETFKIQTPEQENALYESRFQDRGTKLFEKLVSKWIK